MNIEIDTEVAEARASLHNAEKNVDVRAWRLAMRRLVSLERLLEFFVSQQMYEALRAETERANEALGAATRPDDKLMFQRYTEIKVRPQP